METRLCVSNSSLSKSVSMRSRPDSMARTAVPQLVQIDHTQLDVMVVDESQRLVLGFAVGYFDSSRCSPSAGRCFGSTDAPTGGDSMLQKSLWSP